jgi:hypothetical protein
MSAPLSSDPAAISSPSSKFNAQPGVTNDGMSVVAIQESASSPPQLSVAEEMQLFCVLMYSSADGGVLAEESWSDVIMLSVQDKNSFFHLGIPHGDGPPGSRQAFRFVTRARIQTEHKHIAVYIAISLHLPFPQMNNSVDDRVENEYQHFVMLIRDYCGTALVHLAEDQVFGFRCQPSLFPRLVKFQPADSPSASYFEDPSSYWTGEAFYTQWYRRVQATHTIMYDVFSTMRRISEAVFALEIVAVMERLELEEEGDDDAEHEEYKGESRSL